MKLTLQPEDIRKILRLTVTAPGRQIAGSLDATLQGIARGVNLATEEITSSATLGMLLPTPDAQKVCSTTAGILGIAWPEDVDPGTSSDTHLLTLSWQGTDGKKQTYSEDVSAQLYRATETGADTLDLAIAIPEEIAKVAIHLYTGIRTRATVDAFDGTTPSILQPETQPVNIPTVGRAKLPITKLSCPPNAIIRPTVRLFICVAITRQPHSTTAK